MPDLSASWPWLTLVAMGAFHGLNPAMGWLFAVALGLQERRLRAVLAALGPIALGHALSIGLFAVAVGLLGLIVPQRLLLIVGGLALLAFAGYKVVTRFRCVRWVGMRVSAVQLTFWSFLMATAHGAGLMLIPALVRLERSGAAVAAAQDGHAMDHMDMSMPMAMPMPMPSHAPATGGGDPIAPLLGAVAVHTGVLLLVAGILAVVVYQRVGVEVLRRAWVNLDFIWTGVLTITGVITLGVGLWQVLMG